MNRGKEICNFLKEIRKNIADANGISYTPEECPHKGECLGTCPKCENELMELEAELNRMEQEGKQVNIPTIDMF